MPCDQVITQRIDFSAAQNHLDLLKAALEAKGFIVSRNGQSLSFQGHGYNGTYSRGNFTSQQGFEQHVDGVKQEFGKQVVRTAAKKHGWTVTEKNGKLQVRKRV